MVKAELRKVLKLGGTYYVGLTTGIVKQLGIETGSVVKIAALHGQIIIEPLKTDIQVKNTQGRHKVNLRVEHAT